MLTKGNLKISSEFYECGDFTYGIPEVLYAGHLQNNKLKIGKFCSIADNVKIFLGGEHKLNHVSTFPFDFFDRRKEYEHNHSTSGGDVTIGNDVWIGHSVIILSGAIIPDGCVIGAGTVISKSTKMNPFDIVVGNPARTVKRRFSDLDCEKILKTQWWNKDMNFIKEYSHLINSPDLEAFYEKFI